MASSALAYVTRDYWYAAFLLRRNPTSLAAPVARGVLAVTAHKGGKVAERAAATLKEVSNGNRTGR